MCRSEKKKLLSKLTPANPHKVRSIIQYNIYVQSLGIKITTIVYVSGEAQDRMKKLSYVCTRSTSQRFTKQMINQCYFIVSNLFINQLNLFDVITQIIQIWQQFSK